MVTLLGRDLRQDLTGDDVRQLHVALTDLGLTVPASELQAGLFGPGTVGLITTFQQQNGLPGSGVVDAATAGMINRMFNTVSGNVSCATRAMGSGLMLQVAGKKAGTADAILGKGTTSDGGAYSVSYGVSALQRKAIPDIQVRVYNGTALLGTSEVRYNAKSSEVIDVRLPDTAASLLPSEYEALIAALKGHYTGTLGALQESTERSDITYLANKTGWDARTVAMAALADQFSQASGTSSVPGQYYYALFRAGIPANPDAVYVTSPAALRAIWDRAAKQGVIPSADASTLSAVAGQFQTISAQRLLSTPVTTGASTLKDMLATVQLNEAQQQQFARAYAANPGDPATFWKTVTTSLGAEVAARLQNSGKLALLTLNNAPLMQTLAKITGAGLDPGQLAAAGYHQASHWKEALATGVAIPSQIPGDTPDAQRTNYADYLAAQIRLSYPTASIAQMAGSGFLKLANGTQVSAFLTQNQDQFELGSQPVQQFINQKKLTVDTGTLADLKSLQRVHQITPSDTAMAGLLKNNLHSAYQVVQYDRQTFVETFSNDLGAGDTAVQTYNKAVQVHNAVLNVAFSYMTARNGLQLGNLPLAAKQSGGGGQILQPQPAGSAQTNSDSVVAYPTLETLFGSMDFCSCDDCRSILSPAAYLVDLLLYLDKPALGPNNPQTVFLSRRPDVQYLPLTCENTNTVLPYVDVVNETMEYYVANGSLTNYAGHDTDGSATEDLLASPQFVIATAYQTLLKQYFSSPLPFHQALESLRLYFEAFGVPLKSAMEQMRQTDNLERGGNSYGWRDILSEELELSRQEYRLLTDRALTLADIYGFTGGESAAVISDTLANAKQYARRIGISYDDLVAILRTHFVNPNSELIPRLLKLDVTFIAIQVLQAGTLAPADFLALLPTGSGAPDPAEYDGDIVHWLTDPVRFPRIMSMITLSDPSGDNTGCNFGSMELRYSKPAANAADKSTRLTDADFTRLLRFIRLWKKLDWSIEQTDAALCALFRTDLGPLQSSDVSTLAALDSGFSTALPRLGVVSRVMANVSLTVDRDLPSQLACWSNIGVFGGNSLYRQLFLNAAMLKQDSAFAPNGYGEFLSDGTQKLGQHQEAIRGAFSLTADELDRILAALSFDANTQLSLPNLSAIYRRGWLARILRVSVRELLLIARFSGIDPFAAPDIGAAPTPQPSISRFIALIQSLKEEGFKTSAVLYLFWNQDLSGKSSPNPADVTEFGRTLRGDFVSIDDQFSASEDPNGDILRARLTLVYGQDVSDAFFALLDDTLPMDVPYTNATASLDPAIVAADSQIAYDDYQHRLSHSGLVTAAKQAALKSVPGVSAEFKNAIDALFALSQDAVASYFLLHPELKPPYDTYVASPAPTEVKRTALLNAFQPQLAAFRKREQAIQRLSTTASLDAASTKAFLDPDAQPFPLHSQANTALPLLDDFLAMGTQGLAAEFFNNDTATGAVASSVTAAANLDYSSSNGNSLPANPAPGSAISGIWQGRIEIPAAGYYNIVVEADPSATVTLIVDGQNQPLSQNATSASTTTWRNANALSFPAGTLHNVVLTVEKVTTIVTVNWETPKQARETIPGRYLYPPSTKQPLADAYTRFLKTVSTMTSLSLVSDELIWFATNPAYQIAGDGWLNALPVSGDPTLPLGAVLLKPLTALLNLHRIKAALSSTDDSIVQVLRDPAAATAGPNCLLFLITGWNQASLNDILAHFGSNIGGLNQFDLFTRVYDVFVPVQTFGIPADALIKATTNDPDIVGPIVRDFQSALRARYAAEDRRNLIQPVNNQLRSMQRDALVAYILQQLREAGSTIDTPDKLYEYFLMDVQMEPCMQTSRIRHALSSVQLFIDRCFLNLEPLVSASALNADQWNWMKRYRVWQANREVFLFPENWLEPELRDNKSPFFQAIESALTQKDLTEDSAESAMLEYLSALHDVAKLEPCGMYMEENGIVAEDNTVHVIARNSDTRRKYYYRKYEFGSWTAWEEIKLAIEDTPVVPVVWNNRLLLFWVAIHKETPLTMAQPPAPPPGETKFADSTMSAVKTDAKSTADRTALVTIQGLLNWSEYYNGKWQPVRGSSLAELADLGQYPAQGAGAFDRSALFLWADEPQPGQLRISINGNVQRAAFLLYNTHGLPVSATPMPPIFPYGKTRSFETTGPALTADYDSRIPDVPPQTLSRDILTDSTTMKTVAPYHRVSDAWDSPFFLEDRQNVFYVTTTEQPVWIGAFLGYGVALSPGMLSAKQVPPLVAQTPPGLPPKFWGDGGPVAANPGNIDKVSIGRYVSEDAYIRQGLASTAPVQFGTVSIGPSGALPANLAETALVKG